MTSSVRCQSVRCDEIIWGLGGLVDGRLGSLVDGGLGGVTYGDNQGGDYATYSGAILYMYLTL